MDLVFATNNQHKLNEIRTLARSDIRILGLSEAGFSGDIPEDFPTLEQNASQKAWFIYEKIKRNCFADDTGLEVDALNGEPGVYSARYSKMGNSSYPDMDISNANILKLLERMRHQENRNARFRTVIALIIDGNEFQFEGIIQGTISRFKTGQMGFGYDPVFIPTGEFKSFAEMELKKKNEISHRAIATKKLIAFLNKL